MSTTQNKKARQNKQLNVMTIDINVLNDIVQEWESKDEPKRMAFNQNFHGRITTLSNSDLSFQESPCNLTHCSYYEQTISVKGINSQIKKLVEGGANNDAPRFMLNKTKYYIYHILARVGAYRNETTFSSYDISQVTQEKRELNALTIMHLCGNKWCMNYRHYYIGSKQYNDQQSMCHFGLQNSTNQENYDSIQRHYCKHIPKCNANVYKAPLNLINPFCLAK